MATTAIWKVKSNLGRVVDYAANPDKTSFTSEDIQGLRDVMNYTTQDYKTEEQRFVNGINCIPEIAREQMMMVKRQFGKEGGIAAFHGYQSFAPGEVTPEQAHEIGLELAQRLWGDRFQVVVATHLDKEHIHNHFVLNSVSFVDGRKFNDCKASYALMRRTSDELCRERGLSVIKAPEQGRTMSYDTWEAQRQGKPTWYSQIRRDVDSCITRSFHFEHFIVNLQKQGYEVKRGKCIVIRPPGKERFVRLKTLGDNYTEEAIHQRIRQHEQTPLYHRPPTPPKRCYKVKGRPKKLTGFRALYYHYVYLLRKYQRPTAPPRRTRYMMDEIIKFDRYQEQFKFLCKYKIDTPAQFEMLKEAVQADIDALSLRRAELHHQRKKEPNNQTLFFVIQSINQSIQSRRKELSICARIEADIPKVKEQLRSQPPAKQKPKVPERPTRFKRKYLSR